MLLAGIHLKIELRHLYFGWNSPDNEQEKTPLSSVQRMIGRPLLL